MSKVDRFQMGNLDWQVRHMATEVDHEPTMADVVATVKATTLLIPSSKQYGKLLQSALYAYRQIR